MDENEKVEDMLYNVADCAFEKINQILILLSYKVVSIKFYYLRILHSLEPRPTLFLAPRSEHKHFY